MIVLDAVDGELVGHLPSVERMKVPAEVVDLATAADWALAARIGAERISELGEDFGPVLILTAAATERLGLPVELEDRRNLRLAKEHPAAEALAAAGWSASRAGLAPWTHLFRDRDEVHIGVVPWGGLGEMYRWGGFEEVAADPPALAYALGVYAERVIPPSGSTAGCSVALMEAVRPPTRLVFDRGTKRRKRVPVETSLYQPMAPAPPEAPDEHPLAEGRTREQAQDPAHVLFEEAYDCSRPPSQAEGELPYVVGLDINTAFLAAANRLTVGLGEPVHTEGPSFDPKLPGVWLVDLSGAELFIKDLHTKQWRPMPDGFPSPFTPTGEPPTGPAWYATPTLTYARELGVDVRPTEAWIRPEAVVPGPGGPLTVKPGGYLDLWQKRLRDAYMDTLAELKVTPDMGEEEFLAAMATIDKSDPELAAVLKAIKQTAKGGIGKLRERPRGRREGKHAEWPALKRPTWRPDIRAAVLSNARVGTHRKMVKSWQATGLVPLAVMSDCVVYPSAYPTARAVVPRKEDGSPLPGGFRLGPNPGYCKEEGVRSMEWYRDLIAKGAEKNVKINPGRYIKEGRDAVLEGE
nr:transcriptional regulator [Streptomyces coryli]